jgi:hypothetical protein
VYQSASLIMSYGAMYLMCIGACIPAEDSHCLGEHIQGSSVQISLLNHELRGYVSDVYRSMHTRRR